MKTLAERVAELAAQTVLTLPADFDRRGMWSTAMTDPDIIPPRITKVPGVQERIETGPLQFGDDWPGVFIRGDNALADANMLEAALKYFPMTAETDTWIARRVIEGLISTLRSCRVGDTGWPP